MSSSESDADRIRRNDESLTDVRIFDRNAVETLDALKHSTVVKRVTFHLKQLNQEALVKLSEVMKCNTSVKFLSTISLERGLLRERLFATMATSGGWSSIEGLYFDLGSDDAITNPSNTDAENMSSFIIQSENLLTLGFTIAGDEAVPIVETLSRTNTKVQGLMLDCSSNFSAETGGRRLATALARCTCITELSLKFDFCNHQVEMESFQILAAP